jgi:hypothetical protein
MDRINESELINAIRMQSIQGNKNLSKPQTMQLPKKTMKMLKDADVSTDEYLAMLVYAKHLPRGKRELKLNMTELRKQLTSQVQSSEAYLTDVSGLRLGGKVATGGTKFLSQQAHIYNIKNKNQTQTKPVEYTPYSYFKNGFVL